MVKGNLTKKKGTVVRFDELTAEQKEQLRGPAGKDGKDGKDGENGKDGYTPKKGVDYFTKEDIDGIEKSFMSRVNEIAVPSYAYINILGGADNWDAEDVTNASGEVVGVRYGQTLNVNNAVITERSKVDMQITSEQMVVFYQKGIAFVTENDEGVVTVYCVGKIPENDYTIPVVITEVAVNG